MRRAVPELSPSLKEQLIRLRVVADDARFDGNHGERRSRARGRGIEFAERRQYQPGDDLRRLDHHAFVRDGRLYVREFSVTHALEVAILVDTTRSMAAGSAAKADYTRMVAFGLGFVALMAGDGLRLGQAGTDIVWSRRLQGRGRLNEFVTLLDEIDFDNDVDEWPLHRTDDLDLSPRPDVTFVLTDLMFEEVASLTDLARSLGDTRLFHVVDPDEATGGVKGSGHFQLVDSESGIALWRHVNRRTMRAYSEAYETWLRGSRAELDRAGLSYVEVRTDTDPARLFLEQFRTSGILG